MASCNTRSATRETSNHRLPRRDDAHKHTSTYGRVRPVPVVFGMGGDPVKAGLVESLNRPGGNATGFTLLTNEMEPKRLGMLHDLVPDATVIGVLLKRQDFSLRIMNAYGTFSAELLRVPAGG